MGIFTFIYILKLFYFFLLPSCLSTFHTPQYFAERRYHVCVMCIYENKKRLSRRYKFFIHTCISASFKRFETLCSCVQFNLFAFLYFGFQRTVEWKSDEYLSIITAFFCSTCIFLILYGAVWWCVIAFI